MKNCPRCGAENNDNNTFCEYCGHKFVVDEKKCPNCGATINGSSNFCNKCGCDLSQFARDTININNVNNVNTNQTTYSSSYDKQESGVAGFFLGFMLGIIGLIIALAVFKKNGRKYALIGFAVEAVLSLILYFSGLYDKLTGSNI